MKKCLLMAIFVLIALGCDREGTKGSAGPKERTPSGPTTAPGEVSLAEARKGFKTRLVRRTSAKEPVEKPPADVFQIVKYDAPGGKYDAYLTPSAGDGRKRPAIIWITGGDCNTIGDVWSEADPEDEQTASAYRKAGIVMMFPSLRGGNMNPGYREGFFGEVDDVLAAAEFLAQQPHVDPERIYLGGHSTGGTLALLVAECSGRFRAVFAFGPVDNASSYGRQFLPCDLSNPLESSLRSPAPWLEAIKSPTFVFEGTDGNIQALRLMADFNANAKVRFHEIRQADHFNILAPTNQLIAAKILQDTGAACNVSISEAEVNAPFSGKKQ